jgi:pSer/pThr/pTyr-binding forkhead associated (FHA) protein
MTSGKPYDRPAARAFYDHQQRRRRQRQHRLTGHGEADVPRAPVAPNQVTPQTAADKTPRLQLRLRVQGGQEARTFELRPGNLTIGRAPGADIHLDDNTVSHNHAFLLITSEDVTIEDRESTNGTLLNGTRVGEPELLRAGDQLQVGTVVLLVEDADRDDQD